MEFDKNGSGNINEFWNKGGFVLCTSGSAEIHINGQPYTLSRGTVFVVTPLIRISHLHPSPDFRRINLVTELKEFFPIFRLISETGLPLKVNERPCWQLSEKETEFVINQYDRIKEKRRLLTEATNGNERYLLSQLINIITHESMMEIVYNHISGYSTPVDNVKSHNNMVYNFILALHDNYRIHRTVSWYAEKANMSTGHFSAVIRKTTGQSPSEWIASVTIGYARLLLEQSDKTIKEIANDLNFPEQFTFRKFFKKNTGVSPTDYRKSFR